MGNDISEIKDRKAREEIIGGINKNIFVEAGAGAGKTTLIVSRIMNQLKNNWKPENITVITFTNKAAAELYERITGELRREVKKAEDTNSPTHESYDTLKAALLNMDRMQISTIHSFCYKLLTENAFEAEIRLDAEIIQDDEKEKLYDEFLRKWYGKLNWDVRKSLREIDKKNDYALLYGAFLDIVDMPDDYVIMLDDKMKGLTKENFKDLYADRLDKIIQDIFKKVLDDYNAKFPGRGENNGDYASLDEMINAKKLGKKFCDSRELYAQGAPAEKVKEKLKSAVGTLYAKAKAKADEKTWIDEGKTQDEIKSILEEYDSEYENAEISYQYTVVMQQALKAREDFEGIRHTGKYSTCLTNDKLLQLADELVKKSSKVRKKFQNNCLYVDEFQDTDHVQADMIMRLCKDDNGNLREGALFVVGDPKQSIYRFRGAELGVYREVKAEMDKSNAASVYTLGKNFRSDESVINWVNENFKKMPDYVPMESNRSCREHKDFSADKKILSGVYTAYTEDDYIVEIVKKCVDENILIPDKDGFRRIKYKDFLVLSWDTVKMDELYNLFIEAGIPVDIAGRIPVEESQAMNAFVRLFKAIVYPSGIKRHSYQGAHDILNRKLLGDEADYVNENIRLIRRDTFEMDGYATARYLIEHPEFTLMEPVKKLNLVSVQTKLEQMIQSAMQENCMGKQALAKFFDEYVKKKVEREISFKDDSDTVRFMNIHKAKGLEGNIVIILKKNGKDDKFWDKETAYRKRNGEGYECYEIIKPKTNYINNSTALVSYADKKDIHDEAIAESNAEMERLEYVAATRAKEALIVCGAEAAGVEEKDAEKVTRPAPLLEMDYSNCLTMDEFLTGEKKTIMERIKDKVDKAEKAANNNLLNMNVQIYYGRPCDIKLSEGMDVPQLWDISPSALEMSAALDKGEQEGQKEDRPKGNIFGNIMHRSFELLVNTYKKNQSWEETEREIPVCVNRAIMENGDDMNRIHAGEGGFGAEKEKYRTYLVQRLQEFVKDGDIRKMLDEEGTVIYTELAFSYMLTKKKDENFFNKMNTYFENKKISVADDQTVWIHGFSDLVIYNEKSDEIRIIDYKSDSKGNAKDEDFAAALKKKYEGQLALYEESMKQILSSKARVSKTLYNLYSPNNKIDVNSNQIIKEGK